MKNRNLLFTAFSLITLLCCSGCNNVNSIIKKYDNADFTPLTGKYVHFRSRGVESGTLIYFVGKNEGNGPYSVTVDSRDKSIIKISNSQVESGLEDLTHDEIVSALECYFEYPFFLIKVDNEGNVYISPVEQDKPTIMRKASMSTSADIGQYQLYKGNWYIRK